MLNLNFIFKSSLEDASMLWMTKVSERKSFKTQIARLLKSLLLMKMDGLLTLLEREEPLLPLRNMKRWKKSTLRSTIELLLIVISWTNANFLALSSLLLKMKKDATELEFTMNNHK